MLSTAEWRQHINERCAEMARTSPKTRTAPETRPTRLPTWHGQRTLADLDKHQHQAGPISDARNILTQARSWNGVERGLFVYGPDPGIGKTTIVAALAVELGEPHDVAWWSAPQLVRKCRRMVQAREDMGLLLDRICDKTWVALDDLGEDRVTDFYRDLIAEVIERLYDGGKRLLGTANKPKAELSNLFGARIVSRMYDLTRLTYMHGPDLRGG